MPADFQHTPVLLDECIKALALNAGGTYVDVTAGGGGHCSEILRRLGPGGRLIALDRDRDAVAAAAARLGAVQAQLGERCAPFELVHAPMSELAAVLEQRGLGDGSIDGILADLGVSSHQLSTASRGFSFAREGPLDMRMDRSCGPCAADLVNELPESELADIIYRHGDESKSRRIARAIVRRREAAPITTTAELAELDAVAVGGRRGAKIHPATRTFQALRIHLNDEPGELSSLLEAGLRLLRSGGRWAVITFHSGEDRAVKQYFAGLARECTCPPSLPVCVCDGQPQVRLLPRRGIAPGADEMAANPRARSARLRVAELLSGVSIEEETAGEH